MLRKEHSSLQSWIMYPCAIMHNMEINMYLIYTKCKQNENFPKPRVITNMLSGTRLPGSSSSPTACYLGKAFKALSQLTHFKWMYYHLSYRAVVITTCEVSQIAPGRQQALDKCHYCYLYLNIFKCQKKESDDETQTWL